MAEDKWYEIINDEMEDIPLRVERMKSRYWRQAALFMAFSVTGGALMGFGKAGGLIATGCFLAVTGVLGLFITGNICHTQLCLYRAIKEIRKQKENSAKSSPKTDN